MESIIDDRNEVVISSESSGQYSFLPQYNEIPEIFVLKSNALVQKVANTTWLGEQFLLHGLNNLKKRKQEDYEGTSLGLYYKHIFETTHTNFADGMVSVIKNAEIRKALNINSGSYYNTVDEMMNTFRFTNSWNIIYRDTRKGIMATTALVTGTYYDQSKGTIMIKWNPDVENLLMPDKRLGDYTKLNLNITDRLKGEYTLSMYQLFKSMIGRSIGADQKAGRSVLPEYRYIIKLSELKFFSSVISVDLQANDSRTRATINHLYRQDFDEAEDALPEKNKSYTKYSEFRRCALAKAFEEINGFKEPHFKEGTPEYIEEYDKLCAVHHKTDIHFRIEPVRSGRGGKVTDVRVFIRKDDPNKSVENNTVDITPEEMDTLLDEIAELMSKITTERLKVKELRTIAEAADFDLERIHKACSAATYYAQRHDIEKPVGFIISALRDGYSDYEPEIDDYDEAIANAMEYAKRRTKKSS